MTRLPGEPQPRGLGVDFGGWYLYLVAGWEADRREQVHSPETKQSQRPCAGGRSLSLDVGGAAIPQLQEGACNGCITC